MQRPTGVTILAVLAFLGAACTLLVGFAMLVGGAAFSRMLSASPGAAMLAGMGAALGVVCLLFAVLYLAIGVGLWKLKNWARVLTLVLTAIGLVFAVLGLFPVVMHFNIFALIWQLFICAIYVIIIMYLLKPHVKQAFGA
ncbi:MAG: hypothetical protein ACRD50_13395 [Candidatus Acidiferrales bacterium]